jgi:hypothetical protein
MTQVVEHLPSKFEALSLSPSTTKKKKKKKKKKTQKTIGQRNPLLGLFLTDILSVLRNVYRI